MRSEINNKNKILLWQYYEQQSPEEQKKNVEQIRIFTKGYTLNLLFSVVILLMYVLGYWADSKSITLFLINFQLYTVQAHIISIMEAKLSIWHHDGVMIKGELNSNSVYIAKIVYGTSMITMKILFFAAAIWSIGLWDFFMNVAFSYMNCFFQVLVAVQPARENPILEDFKETKRCLFMQSRLKEIVCDNDEEICSICHCPMVKGVQLRCGHVFHRLCLMTWFNQESETISCPYCREVLS